MLAVPIFDMNGKQGGEIEVDPAALGGWVRHALVKQAIVSFLDHQRQFSARTKRRSDVAGSTRKLFRQKGTGNARAGSSRTPVRRGGGHTFAKRRPQAFKAFPKKMRRLARDSAILAKIKADGVVVISDFQCSEPKTKVFSSMLSAVGAGRGCVFAMHEPNNNAHLSGRNLAKTEIRLVGDLNAYELLRRDKLVFTKQAFEQLLGDSGSGS